MLLSECYFVVCRFCDVICKKKKKFNLIISSRIVIRVSGVYFAMINVDYGQFIL